MPLATRGVEGEKSSPLMGNWPGAVGPGAAGRALVCSYGHKQLHGMPARQGGSAPVMGRHKIGPASIMSELK